MTGEIVAAVLWGVSALIGPPVFVWLGVAVGALFSKPGPGELTPAFVGMVFGWILGLAFSVTALVLMIVHIVLAVQLA